MEYIFKCKKGRGLWKKFKIEGHSYIENMDRMDVFFRDGSVRSFGEWSKYDLILGTDWVLATKKKMESESGTEIKLKDDKGK